MEEYIYYIQNRGLQKTELFYIQAKCLIWTLVVQNSYYHSKTPCKISNGDNLTLRLLILDKNNWMLNEGEAYMKGN
jgi:hypothetical protein